MIRSGAISGLNHALKQNPWAADRLSAFAEQNVEFRCPPFPPLRLKILEGGSIEQAAENTANALTVKLEATVLPLLLLRDDAALKRVEIEGSADLADAVRQLFRELRWDVEEDLSKFTGDALAHRLVSTGKAFAEWQQEAAQRFAENLAEYLTEEQPMLARPAEVEKFRAEVEALVQDMAGLSGRIEKIEGPGS